MTTSRPERLLQTIVSRCQELIVPPLSDEIVIKTLVARGLCSEDEASLVAPFAEGDIQRAADFVSEDVRTLRNSALALLRSALRGKDYRNALSDAAAEIGDERSKAKAEATLSLLAVWLRDAYALALGGPDVRLVNADDRSALEKFAAAFGSADLLSVITVIERAARDIQRNTSITLTLLTAMMDIRVIIARTRVSA
jgi:DNA polymerase-3 subunit delta'